MSIVHDTRGEYLIRPMAPKADIHWRTGRGNAHFSPCSPQGFRRTGTSSKHTHTHMRTTRTPYTRAPGTRRRLTPSYIYDLLPVASPTPGLTPVNLDPNRSGTRVLEFSFLPLFLGFLLASSAGRLGLRLAGNNRMVAVETCRAHASAHATDMAQQDVNLGFWLRRSRGCRWADDIWGRPLPCIARGVVLFSYVVDHCTWSTAVRIDLMK